MLNPLGFPQQQQSMQRSAAVAWRGQRRDAVQRDDGHAAAVTEASGIRATHDPHDFQRVMSTQPHDVRSAQRSASDGRRAASSSRAIRSEWRLTSQRMGGADLRQPHDDRAALQAPPADVGRRGAVVLDRAPHRGRRDRDRVVRADRRRRLRRRSPSSRAAAAAQPERRRSRRERRGERGLGSVLVGARRVQQRRHAAWLVRDSAPAPPGPPLQP